MNDSYWDKVFEKYIISSLGRGCLFNVRTSKDVTCFPINHDVKQNHLPSNTAKPKIALWKIEKRRWLMNGVAQEPDNGPRMKYFRK